MPGLCSYYDGGTPVYGNSCRYVAGLMIGEGYTHAWVEVYTQDGWYGLDPTNNLHIDEYYIKLAMEGTTGTV